MTSQALHILLKPVQQDTSQLQLRSKCTLGTPSLASHGQAMRSIAKWCYMLY